MLGDTYNNEPITYNIAYNPSGGIVEDLIEVFEQKLAEDPTLSWQLFSPWMSAQFIIHGQLTSLPDYFGSNGAHRLAQNVAQLSGPDVFLDATVQEHVANYKSALLSGKRVMVVSHSQGNLYANAAFNKLHSDNIDGSYNPAAFGIAAIATPAAYVATGDGYVTSRSDLVIAGLRALAPATLLANDHSVPQLPAEDPLGHGFNEIYTRNFPVINAHVMQTMRDTLARISGATPSRTQGGPITATLTWSDAGDVDLHIYEPSLFHVYYAATRGDVGFLDFDDRFGIGPEHYYAACDNFQTGSYSFGVNYYCGTDPFQCDRSYVTEHVALKLSVLGVNYPSRNINLDFPLARAGDDSPRMLYRVVIDKDADGNFTASVQ